jgi:transcriptional regulator with XRE-family HTH domain
MKQPELGRKISELRKSKGLTQEELVEKCNISVRTIQRIENGEVTPRSYTIKTILAALDYDLSKIPDDENPQIGSFISWLKKCFLLDIDTGNSSDFLVRQLNIAWIAGLLYFLLGFFEGTADYFRFEEHRIIVGNSFYVIIKVLVLISFVFFQRGFILTGVIFHNYLLRIISFILIFGNVLILLYDIASIFYWPTEREYVLGAEALTFGGIGIIYGVSLMRLKKPIGDVAIWAGIFEIIAACFFLTIILSFVGFIVLIPAELFEIIILFKVSEMIKSKQLTENPD